MPMNPFSRLFNPLRQAAAAFFKHDVALRRNEGSVHIVLEKRSERAKGKPPTRAEVAERKEKAELTLMRAELAALLDDMPETRQTMRHLVFVEQALARKGLKALHRLPLDVLQRALEQLEGLVTNWSPLGLANLRSKMAVAVIDREHMDPEAEADAYRTAAVLDHPVTQLPGVGTAAAAQPDARSEDEALAAAYAALGDLAPAVADDDPAGVEMQAELGSRSAKAVAREAARGGESPSEIRLRELQSS